MTRCLTIFARRLPGEELGDCLNFVHLASALRVWDRSARKMGLFFENYHLYLTPTTAFPPAKVGELHPKPAEKMLINLVNTLRAGWLLRASGIIDKMAQRSLARTPFTQLANLCGLPAMSVPLHWTPEGLPCGSHFTAPFGEEATLFRLAAQLDSMGIGEPCRHRELRFIAGAAYDDGV